MPKRKPARDRQGDSRGSKGEIAAIRMIKVVYNTNVIVAALIKPDGLPALLLDLAAQHRVQLFLSSFFLREYEAVLRRPKFGFTPAKVRIVVRAIRAHAPEPSAI